MIENDPDLFARHLRAVFDSADHAIYSKDRRARITSWNPAAELLYGLRFAALNSGVVESGSLSVFDWLGIAAVPVAMVGVALLTARRGKNTLFIILLVVLLAQITLFFLIRYDVFRLDALRPAGSSSGSNG